MKKVLLGLVALSAVSFAQSDTYLNVRFGGDFGASYDKVDDEGRTVLSDDTDGFGGELALEGYKSLTDNFDLGLGLAYQFHADRETQSIDKEEDNLKGSGAEYKSLPVYLTAKYNFNLDSQIRPYLKANLGYSFNFDGSDVEISNDLGNMKIDMDLDDGLYWALGGGLEYNNFTVDLMYAVTTAEAEDKENNEKHDGDYARFVLSAGYRFNL